MKRLAALDLVAPAPWPRAGGVLALAALAAVAAFGHSGWQLRQDSAALAASTPAGRVTVRQAAPPSDAERRALVQIAGISAQLEAPWFDLLAAFEQHASGGVGLLRLEPDARQLRIRVQAEARDDTALFDYLTALESDPRLADVQLLNHAVVAEAPGRPVRFLIKAGWPRGAGAPGREAAR